MKLIEDFNAISSLEFLTASRIVIRIWNSSGIVRSISHFLENTVETEIERIWGEIEDRVKTIVGRINEIPRLLLENMEALIIRIGYHIRAMRSFITYSPHLSFYYYEKEDDFERNEMTRRGCRELKYPPDFRYSDLEFPVNHWTPYGTVDTKKLDRILALDDRFDLHFRYNLACIDCFVEIIQQLFLLLSDEEKTCYLSLGRNKEHISYWTHRLMDNMPRLIDSMAHYYNLAVNEDVMEGDEDVMEGDEDVMEGDEDVVESDEDVLEIFRNVSRIIRNDPAKYEILWGNVINFLNKASIEKDRDFYRELHFSDSVDEVAFKFSLIHGNKAGIEYFRDFLKPEIFNLVLENNVKYLPVRPSLEMAFGDLFPIRPQEHYSDALYFVLSQLSEDKRNEYLKSYGFIMLLSFVMYPFFGLFSKYVNIMVSEQTNFETSLLLRKITKLESLNMYSYGYDLFKDLWHSVNDSHKEYARVFLPVLNPVMGESLMERIRRADES